MHDDPSFTALCTSPSAPLLLPLTKQTIGPKTKDRNPAVTVWEVMAKMDRHLVRTGTRSPTAC